uniref:(northern house mosquito) hypothetical protein n=1 Tax=Culex pipiens TaxID=7175 RepID=A0A8D7ZSI7_CULPI
MAAAFQRRVHISVDDNITEDNADTDNDSISLTNDETEEEDDEDDDPPPSVQEVALVTSSSLDRQDTVDSQSSPLVIEEASGREEPVAPPEDEVGVDALSADLADDHEEVDERV